MMLDMVLPMYVTAMKPSSGEVWFARNYDLKAGSFGDRLRACQPTLFLGVPRVWEKVAEKMKAIGASITGKKKQISTWAKGKGLEHQMNCQMGGSGAYPKYYGLADKIVLSKVKAKLGLDKCKVGFTGAAPIGRDTLEYFGRSSSSLEKGRSCLGTVLAPCLFATQRKRQPLRVSRHYRARFLIFGCACGCF